jgi:uroporphyrinogen-III decarboxylase
VDIRKNPEKVKALLNYCQKVITRYAQALIEAGADIILVAEPSGSQLSAAGFEDFSLFYTRAIISALKRQSILHVCGRAEHLIEKMCQSGATALSIDDVTLASVIKRVPADITLIGNISPIKFVYSSPEEIKKETLSLLAAIESKNEFIVAPGCDLAPQTPLANILAFTEAAKEYENSKKSIRNKE